MRRVRLSTLLVGGNVGLLLLAVVGVAIVAMWMLQRLADDQALRHLERTGHMVQQQIDSTGEALLTSAQLLSQRPTLHRLLLQDDPATLTRFLARFQETSRLDSTAVLENGRVLVQSGAPIAWADLWAARHPGETRFLVHPTTGDSLLIGAWTTIPESAEQSVAVALRLDDTFARQLSTAIGIPVMVLPRQNALPGTDGTPTGRTAGVHTAMRARVFDTNAVATARLDERGAYLAIVPLQAPSGAVMGVVELALPTASVTHSLQQLGLTLLMLALAVGALGATASFALGRRLARPLQRLGAAAERIGRGDLVTPVVTGPRTEIGAVAARLEDMRGRLLQLTGDLQRQQAEAQAIITGIVEGVFSVDRERRIRYLNPQAAMLLGTTSEAAIGRFCGDVLHPQTRDGVRPCEQHCPIVHARFRGGARATEHLQLGDGQRRSVVITSAPAVGEMQMQVLRDETEIEATRRLRDAILANISHEFRTPLSAQLASIEMLLDQLPDLTVAQIGQLVRAQQRGTLRLTQLIDNLLESARIEAGHHTIRRQAVALDEVVEEALELTKPLLDQRQQLVQLDLPYPLPPIRGDARRLTQVFVNLLGNATKFAPERSTIVIGGAVTATMVALWVVDEGPGLPVKSGQELFQRFVRASGDEPEQSGVGLGLWLVKSIVERHGGRVEAQSDAHGTRMSVVLPLEQCDENSDR